MQVSQHTQNGSLIIELNGKIVADPDTTEFKDAVKNALMDGHRDVIVDLSGVDWMSSTGLASLVYVHSMVQEVGGRIAFAGATPSVKQTIEISRLQLVLDMKPTVADAVIRS